MKIACLLVAAPVLCVAADANALTAAEKKAGWELLFDGKTMNGWEAIDKKTPAGDSWTIEDGTLKSVAKPKLREDLFTAKKYGDFELVFEWKVSKNGNSGLKYRVQDRFYVNERRMREFGKFENLANDAIRTRATKREEATQEYVVGFEYQVIDNGGHPDARRGGYYQAGALYGMIPPVKAAEKPVGEWNQAAERGESGGWGIEFRGGVGEDGAALDNGVADLQGAGGAAGEGVSDHAAEPRGRGVVPGH
jgi:hypothetical protein